MTGLYGEIDRQGLPKDDQVAPQVLDWHGRIDNRWDLLLQLKDRLKDDASSTAIVAAAYQRWGVQGLGRIVGDWSAVLFDPSAGQTVLASDYAGVRPLYYFLDAGTLHWSSRLETLVGKLHLRAIDETYVAGFLAFGGCPHRTPWSGVQSVPPGHAVLVDRDRVGLESFWSLPAGDAVRYADERRYDEQFTALFREAVAVRLQTPRPVVAELSGGLDSSSVVIVAKELIRGGLVPAPAIVPVTYAHHGSLDAPFVQEVEKWCGVEAVRLSMHDTPLAAESDASDATPGNSASLEKAAAATARRRGADVFLTGQNGDLVTGNWFDDSLQVAAALRRGQIGRACVEALAWSKQLRIPIAWILWRASRTLWRAPKPIDLCRFDVATDEPEPSLLQPAFERRHLADAQGLFSAEWTAARPERRKHFHALTMMRQMRSLQVPEAMDGLDYTHPFAHRPLVEFLMNVPADVLCRPGEPRRLMRRALGELWPPRLRARRSKGLMGAPQFEALRPLADRLLAEQRLEIVERGWVNKGVLTARLEKLKHGIDRDVHQVRQAILLELWLKARTARQPSGMQLMAV